jgi:hypothetical protein
MTNKHHYDGGCTCRHVRYREALGKPLKGG